jgi:hypothetical protein
MKIPCDWCKNAPDFKSDRIAKYFVLTGELDLREPFREWYICREHLDVIKYKENFAIEVRSHVRVNVDCWTVKELTPRLMKRYEMWRTK